MQLSAKQCNWAQKSAIERKTMHDQIQCNRVSVRTQGTVKLVAIRRLHCTCYIVSVALCLLYNVCCIAFVALCLFHYCVYCIVSVALRPGVSGLRWLAQRAWGELIVPFGFSCQCHHPLLFCILFHSNCNRLQELPVYSWSMVGSVANQMREGAMFFLLSIRAQERCHRAYRGRRLPKILPGNAMTP